MKRSKQWQERNETTRKRLGVHDHVPEERHEVAVEAAEGDALIHDHYVNQNGLESHLGILSKVINHIERNLIMQKLLFITMVILLTSTLANAQRPNEEYITDQDIEIRFPGAMDSDGDWYNPTVITIEYSTLPMGAHSNKAKLGLQTWEFELQVDGIPFEKGIITIDVSTMPNGFRVMEMRVRVRVDDNNAAAVIGPWSNPNHVKIIGKPGDPFRTG